MAKADAPITHRVSLAASTVKAKPDVVVVRLADVHPSIRIAHRVKGALNIEERVIVDHEIVLFLRGEGRFETRTEKFPLRPHDILFIPPFLPHVIYGNATTEHIGVHFDLTRRRDTRHPEKRRPYQVRLTGGLVIPRHRRLVGRDEIERALIEIVRLFAKDSEADQLAAHGRLIMVLARLLEPAASEETEREGERLRDMARVERVVAAMGSRLAEELTPEDLCAESGLASSQFYAIFREQTGYSPMEYLRRLRIDTARTLLQNAELSVKEIAALVGFSDPYYFSRAFKQVAGASPERYRKSTRGRSPTSS